MGVNDDHVGSRGRWFEQDPRVEPLPGKALPYFSGAGKVIGLYEHCCHVPSSLGLSWHLNWRFNWHLNWPLGQ